MRNFFARRAVLLAVPLVAGLFLPEIISHAQAPASRITAEIDNSTPSWRTNGVSRV